jgi:hypothetical protein
VVNVLDEKTGTTVEYENIHLGRRPPLCSRFPRVIRR